MCPDLNVSGTIIDRVFSNDVKEDKLVKQQPWNSLRMKKIRQNNGAKLCSEVYRGITEDFSEEMILKLIPE